MKQSTALKLAAGVAAATIGGLFIYSRSTRPPVINPSVPEPAKPVDLDRYVGKWYELARHENKYQKGMDACTADYSLRSDGKLGIINGGQRVEEDERDVVEGSAIIVDEETNAKLKVSFFGPLYVGDYWVLDHCDDYQWAIVGEPTGRFLWILSRTRAPKAELLQQLLNRVEELGYDRWALRITRHD